MSEEYRLLLGANSCDVCTSMEGTYPHAPDVPFHENCACEVEKTSDAGDDCTLELRNVERQEVKYSDFEIHSADMYNDSPVDIEGTLPVELRVLNETWDVPELREACDWDPPEGTEDATFTVPAESAGEVSIRVELEITQIICRAEEWEVCRRAAPPSESGSSFAHTLTERMVRTVGGGATAVTGILGAEIEHLHETDDYYDDDDEVPV